MRLGLRGMAVMSAGLLLVSCGGDGGGGGSPGGTGSAPTPSPSPSPSPSPVTVAPTITAQPANTTAAAGYPVSFTVTASGTTPTYRWKRNGVVIDGATGATLTLAAPTVADDGTQYAVEVSNGAGTVTSRTVKLGVLTLNPVAVNYTSFNGDTMTRYAWEGRTTAILTASSDRSFATMAAILGATDATYDYYLLTTGYTPYRAKTVNGKAAIAEVPATCGAGCGYLGFTGIEMQTTYFGWLYDGVNANRQFDQVVFYEFGRNFWFLGRQLAYKSPDSDPVTTGFAIAMRFLAIEAIGVAGAPFNQNVPYADFRSRVENFVDTYAADTTQTFDNTLRMNKSPTNPYGLSGSDLFASFILRLRRDYGGEAFMARLWVEAGKRPAATTTQDAVDNFVIAASISANRNLVPIFTDRWRWPVSSAARAAVANLPSA